MSCDEAMSSDETMSSDDTMVGDGVGDSVDSVDSVNRGSVDSVNGSSSNVSTSRGRGVLGLSRVGHLSDVAVIVVGVVGDSLDPTVRQVDGVGSLHNTVTIVRLRLLEVSFGVVVRDCVLVCVGGGLGQVGVSVAHRLGSVNHGGGVLGGRRGGSDKGEGEDGLHVV